MEQITPGPWTQVDFVEVRAPGGQTVAWCPATDDAVDGATIAAANARLISKSPELLLALETLVADIDSAKSLNEFIIGERANRLEDARILIAEIEGGA